MRTPNKSRSRNKNNNRRPNQIGNVVNRVFDSNGPEGRVRGTPNQIIEKYQSLAQDATLSGNRVESENFSQHAEHYIRMLSEAQAELNREMAQRQAEQDQRMSEQQRNRPEPDQRTDGDHRSENQHHAENDHRGENQHHADNDQRHEIAKEMRDGDDHSENVEAVADALADPREEKPKKFRRSPVKRPVDTEHQTARFDENNAPDFLKIIND